MSMSGDEMVKVAKQQVQPITISEVNSALETNEKLFLLDVREHDEWESGHIEGATLLPRGRLEGNIEKLVPDKNTAIVCH